MSKNKAQIVAVMGASGSGKSLFIKSELRRLNPARLVVWDSLGEYSGRNCTSLGEALALAKATRFNIIFRPTSEPVAARKQFDYLCRIVYAAGNCVFVAEELAFVTSSSFAPAGWSECTLKGRHKGLVIYGTSQRPASIDKHFFGNATCIRTGRLNFSNDIKTLADVLQVPHADVQALKPLDFISRNMADGKISRGVVPIPR